MPSPSIGPKLFLAGPKQFGPNILDMVQKAKFSSGKSILAYLVQTYLDLSQIFFGPIKGQVRRLA